MRRHIYVKQGEKSAGSPPRRLAGWIRAPDERQSCWRRPQSKRAVHRWMFGRTGAERRSAIQRGSVILHPNVCEGFVFVFQLLDGSVESVKPVLWWASLCRSHCCPMSAVGGSEAEGRRSLERWPQWELDPRRGNRGLQTPGKDKRPVNEAEFFLFFSGH